MARLGQGHQDRTAAARASRPDHQAGPLGPGQPLRDGIGRAIAARFAASGDTVIITGRHPGRLRRAAEELGARGIIRDAADPAQLAALGGDLGPELDVLVNNAGGNTDLDAAAGPESPDGEASDLGASDLGASDLGASDLGASDLKALAASWRANLDANLLSAVLTTQAAKDRLTPGGSVISIGSIGAERGSGSYGVAKAGLSAWNTGLSAELGPRGITANVISAGYIAGTNFFRTRSPASGGSP